MSPIGVNCSVKPEDLCESFTKVSQSKWTHVVFPRSNSHCPQMLWSLWGGRMCGSLSWGRNCKERRQWYADQILHKCIHSTVDSVSQVYEILELEAAFWLRCHPAQKGSRRVEGHSQLAVAEPGSESRTPAAQDISLCSVLPAVSRGWCDDRHVSGGLI